MKYIKKKYFISICFLLTIFILTSYFFHTANSTEEKSDPNPKLERYFVFESIPLNLEEITKSSDRIFAGRCIKKEEIENDPESSLTVIKYTFKITDGIKGTINKKEITFRQWKPTVRTGGYKVGKKYIIFLYPDSNIGLTSPVGFLQGIFEVQIKDLKEVVRNRMGNIGLGTNLRTHKKLLIRANAPLANHIQVSSEKGEPIEYKEFIEAVKYLVKQ